MAIKFLNIRSGEVRVAETEPHIAAMWASSDHSPNITQGQDFGWRMAPEVVVEMKRIKQDYPTLLQIAQRINKNVDELQESDILMYISAQSTPESAPVAQVADYQDDYDLEVRRLSEEQTKAKQTQVSHEVDQVPPVEPTAQDWPTETTETGTTEEPTTPVKDEKPNKPAK